MNITVKIHGSRNFICRPDTTWERESRDFYSPEFASELFYTPVVFARISKAGKCIGRKFAARYYDGLNFGILLYPGEILNAGRPESLGAASILDHTSILPFPLFQPVVFATSGNSFTPKIICQRRTLLTIPPFLHPLGVRSSRSSRFCRSSHG